MLILFGQNLKTKSHSHHAVEIIISLNELFSIECEGRHMKSKGVIIRHDVAHMISSGNGITAYILIEPEDPLGRALNRVLNSKSLLTLDKKITSEISQHFKKHLHTDHFEADMKQCLEDIFIPFSKHDDETYYLDERIKQIVRHINSSLTVPVKPDCTAALDILFPCSMYRNACRSRRHKTYLRIGMPLSFFKKVY